MRKIFTAIICGMILCLGGCSSGNDLGVEKKTNVEYTPGEVKKIFERNGYEITHEKDNDLGIESLNITVTPEDFDVFNEAYLFCSKIRNEGSGVIFFNIPVSKGYNMYMIDPENKNKDLVSITNNGSDCIYNVELGKDESTDSKCDKIDIEDCESIYVKFYEFLNKLNIGRQELIDFFETEMEYFD